MNKAKTGAAVRHNIEALDQIATENENLTDAKRFVRRYGASILAYLRALLHSDDDAEEVFQELLLGIVERGPQWGRQIDGRFRDYLKATVRNAAFTYLRRRQRDDQKRVAMETLSQLPDDRLSDDPWIEKLRSCLIERTWRALERHEHCSRGNLFYTSLKASIDFPHENSAALSRRVSVQCGRSVTPQTYRKQVSRARRKFLELLRLEAAQALQCPTRQEVDEELAHLGLTVYLGR